MGFIDSFPSFSWNCLVYFFDRGVGKLVLRLMQEYFKTDSGTSEPQDLLKKGNFCGYIWLQIVYVLLFEGKKQPKITNQFSI